MQFIKSLFCWHGYDNRLRFILISITSFIAFIILNESLNEYKLSAVFILMLCSSTCLATTRRRLNDAQLHNNWILAPAGSFLFTGLIIVYIGHAGSYWLLLVPLLLALLLLTYPSKRQKHYILGYNGPVDLTDFQAIKKPNSRNSQRVEPTMNGNNTNQPAVNDSDYRPLADSQTNKPSATFHANHSTTDKHNNIDIGESIRLVLFSKKNARITIAVTSLLLVIALLISLIFGNSKTVKAPQEQIIDVQEITIDFQNKLTLPDNFSLMLSPDSALVIQWQTEADENHEVWALANAKGDKNCENITFNNGESIRSYRVSVKNNDYYAYFSPLDTKALINSIAFKNKFSLCGYNFSLKGSQAILAKSPYYTELLEY